ncbi:MAG TPA: hypothetical protein VFT17_01700 [Propionibacteriaceae bacterium]|nr:hypothetical protein [Propionibacteriaceae bacterium]
MAAKLLPSPEPDEIVPSLSKQPQVRIEIELLRLFRAVRPETKTIMQVVVDM